LVVVESSIVSSLKPYGDCTSGGVVVIESVRAKVFSLIGLYHYYKQQNVDRSVKEMNIWWDWKTYNK